MSSDPNKKSARTFQCRDVLWETFEQMARELECSVDYLVNEAMKQYAKKGPNRSAAPGRDTSPPSQPDAPSMGRPMPPPPMPATVTPPPVAASLPPAPGRPSGLPSLPKLPGAPSPAHRGPSMPPPPPPGGGRPPPPGLPTAPAGYGAGAPSGRLPPMPSSGGRVPPPMPGMPSAGPPPPMPGGRVGPPPPMPGGGFPPPPMPGGAPPPMPGMNPSSTGRMSGPPQMPAAPPPPPPPPAPSPAVSRMLFAVYGAERVQVNKDRFIIGRGKQTSDLTIKDPNVSRQHAMVEFLNGQYYMVDMGSTNGVEYQGQRIARKVIAEGDIYKICDHEVRFTYA
jgi:neural Wiskott-Aldrich syndrome protein